MRTEYVDDTTIQIQIDGAWYNIPITAVVETADFQREFRIDEQFDIAMDTDVPTWKKMLQEARVEAFNEFISELEHPVTELRRLLSRNSMKSLILQYQIPKEDE